MLHQTSPRVFFTNPDMDAEGMTLAHEKRPKNEKDFKWEEGVEVMPLSPRFLQQGDSILVHSVQVVKGLMRW